MYISHCIVRQTKKKKKKKKEGGIFMHILQLDIAAKQAAVIQM